MSSTTSPPQKEWLVHIPDHPSSLSKRLAVRPTHLSALKPSIESGKIVFGGATLTAQPTDSSQPPDMNGSVMLIKADSEEEVREWIRNDAYTKGGVWDADKAVVYPFRCAVRTAM